MNDDVVHNVVRCAVDGYKSAYRINHTHSERFNDREIALGAYRAYEHMLRVLGYDDDRLQKLKVEAMNADRVG